MAAQPGAEKIFVLGLNKTGTRSLHNAFELLGYNSAHYLDSGGRLLHSRVKENLRHRQRLFSGAEEYHAFSDWAGHTHWHLFCRLDKQYPGSKFILLIRDFESWLDSCERHVARNRLKKNYTGGWLTVDRDRSEKVWRAHQRRIRRYFQNRPEDFLEMNIVAGDGWEKLCPFLKVPVPDLPFPHVKSGPGGRGPGRLRRLRSAVAALMRSLRRRNF